jgi:methylenetetrahydrofolate reductase (NADPH)
MFDTNYLVELLSPKRVEANIEKRALNLFAERYYRIIDSDMGISVPDNPMGQPRYSLVEMITQAGLPVVSGATVMNLNTFHTKETLDKRLLNAKRLGIRYLLVVRGDGGPDLSKLDPQSIGGSKSVVTSIDLIRYINAVFPDSFVTGAAFNQYNQMPFEFERLKKKIEAGARFVITQPVIGKDPIVDKLYKLDISVVPEAWMSSNIDLLLKSVRSKDKELGVDYDPEINLRKLRDAYADSCIYLSMLSFRRSWKAAMRRQ